MKRPLWIPWRWWRRAAQFALLLLFLWLFRRTEYFDSDHLAGGENLFFRLDPLLGAAAMLGARQWIATFWPALVVLVSTVLLGRFFCGWVCPLGTLLDYFHFLVRPIARRAKVQGVEITANSGRIKIAGKAAKYSLLIGVLAAALLAFPLVGLVDPFSLLMRAMTLWGDPMLYRGANASLGWLGNHGGSETVDAFIRQHLLPFRAMAFYLAWLSAAILAAIFALELFARRFWCRYLCPLGGMLGLVGRQSMLKRLPGGVCKSCSHCAAICRMDALDAAGGFSPENCTLCMDCVDFCPKGIARFGLKQPKRQPRGVDLSRRSALAGIVVGAAIPGAAAVIKLVRPRPLDPYLLRPPGAAGENTFLNLCVRCGECMKVCPTGVLQPAVFEAGLDGIFSPRLVPRFVFEQTCCEFACTLCGQVCPTGAIPRLTEAEKHARPTGKAYFDHARCRPWAENTACIRCEEMCPTPDKAIKILRTFTVKNKDGQEIEIQQPYVDHDLCVGCGSCETNCPVDGPSAIRVQRVDAPDPGTEFLLKGKTAKSPK
jgi:polyferredoxin